MLDGAVYCAPFVKDKVSSGYMQISGMENLDEAKLLEAILKSGTLSAPLNIISNQIIGSNTD